MMGSKQLISEMRGPVLPPSEPTEDGPITLHGVFEVLGRMREEFAVMTYTSDDAEAEEILEDTLDAMDALLTRAVYMLKQSVPGESDDGRL